MGQKMLKMGSAQDGLILLMTSRLLSKHIIPTRLYKDIMPTGNDFTYHESLHVNFRWIYK